MLKRIFCTRFYLIAIFWIFKRKWPMVFVFNDRLFFKSNTRLHICYIKTCQCLEPLNALNFEPMDKKKTKRKKVHFTNTINFIYSVQSVSLSLSKYIFAYMSLSRIRRMCNVHRISITFE